MWMRLILLVLVLMLWLTRGQCLRGGAGTFKALGAVCPGFVGEGSEVGGVSDEVVGVGFVGDWLGYVSALFAVRASWGV